MRALRPSPILVRHLAAGALALGGCGGGSSDPMLHHDGGTLDGAPIPPPPVLGAQLARMGRPLTTTLLIGTFAPPQVQAAMRAAYNQAPDPATWLTTTIATGVTISDQIHANLGVFDAWDTDFTPQVLHPGCGNSLAGQAANLYGPPTALFGDDELYVDTAMSSCTTYLALELEYAIHFPAHNQCGGRMPSHDVVDMTYSVLAGGLEALDVPSNNYAPKIHDGVAAHKDLNETVFPFLGPPHP